MTLDGVLHVVAAVGAVVASILAGLNSYFVFRLNAKFDKLTGRVDEQGETLRAHVNAPGLHRPA